MDARCWHHRHHLNLLWLLRPLTDVVAAGASLPAQAGGMVDKEQAQAWVMEATESYAFALQAAGKACASNTKLAFVSGGTGYTG